MSQYVDPWSGTLRGSWRESMLDDAAPCHYKCGNMAVMKEPGKPWRTHKVCAESNPSEVDPLTIPDGEDRESKAMPRALGCGIPEAGQTSGRVCAGTGAESSCQLCPASPTYWRRSS